MPAVRRRSKFLVLLVAVVGLAVALSACADFKEDSLSVSQPGGIGSARVHFELCTEADGTSCGPNEGSGQAQYLLGIAVTPGFSPPATITAAPSAGGPPIVFSRNDQVASEISAAVSSAIADEPAAGGKPWPPAGLEGVGYLSGVVNEVEGATVEWTVDADFGLPAAADGGPFAGSFKASPAMGVRFADDEHPADRPVHCLRPSEGSPDESDAICFSSEEEAAVGTSELKIAAPPSFSVFVGGSATVPFGFNLGSTASALPSFNVTAGSNLPGAGVTVSAPSFTPPAVDPGTHRSSGSETVTVAVPKTAKPGVYSVTITATTPQGGSTSQVATFEVTKPKLKVGKVKLNRANGTAKLSIGVPSAGTLAVSGKGIAKAKRSAKGPKTVKATIKAKGKAKTKLNATGKAKVKAKIVFKPENGAPVTKTKSITLKKKLP